MVGSLQGADFESRALCDDLVYGAFDDLFFDRAGIERRSPHSAVLCNVFCDTVVPVCGELPRDGAFW